MSTNKTLFQEAIADAKAVREAALANAKAALEETMTPRLQSMLAARLEENYDETLEEEDGFTPHDTGDEQGQSGFEAKEQGRPGYGDAMEEELDLSAILAELENESQLEEAKKKDKEEEDEKEEEEEVEDEKEEEEEYSPEVENEENAEPVEIKDMNVEELLNLVMDELEGKIADIVQQKMGTEAPAGEMEEPEMDMNPMNMEPNAASKEEEININELLAELDAMYENDDENESMKYEVKKMKSKEDAKKEKEMKEALSVINTLRSELNEVNLLNAKLIYVNKIFKSKSLTEAQKIQVITSFDKATTTREAKVVFESLTTALAAPKKPLKESYGFASRAAGLAPRKQIVESNDVVARMQKLANIIK
jgi:hypothetical protein